MAQVELDSFVSKLKSLWQLGISATLNVEVIGGKASVEMKADLGYIPPPLHNCTRHGSNTKRGPAYYRRQARRKQNTIESHEDAAKANDQADTPITEAECEVIEQIANADTGEVTEAQIIDDEADSRKKVSEVENELRAEIKALQHEIQEKNEVIAVNNMLHEDFKELVKNKYFYSSDDEISDYEPDDTKRELSRQEFFRRKMERRCATEQKNISCQKCNFIAKSEQGLKTHIKKKH